MKYYGWEPGAKKLSVYKANTFLSLRGAKLKHLPQNWNNTIMKQDIDYLVYTK